MKLDSRPTTGSEKSRLGRLLVSRGYISDEQLESALHQQRTSGRKLGEILIAEGLLSERALVSTLKRQKRYRYVAAFAAVIAAPLQPVLSFAAAAPALMNAAPVATQTHRGGMQPLSDLEMRDVQAQGIEELFGQIEDVSEAAGKNGKGQKDALDSLELMVRGLVPIVNLLDADVNIRGVHYRPGELPVRILADGGVRMLLPQQIERISLENIRVQNSNGPAMGNVYISDVRFSEGSHVTIRGHQ